MNRGKFALRACNSNATPGNYLMKTLGRITLFVMATCFCASSAAVVDGSGREGVTAENDPLSTVILSDHRTPQFVARDRFRHPAQTLEFFDVRPHMSVVEIWPGKGWYTEILSPYLKGDFYAAHFPTGAGVPFYEKYRADFAAKLAARPDIYSSVKLASFDPKRGVLSVPDGSVDRVLTFRNVHNWLRSESELTAFELFYKALKPGGVLGVVEHRAPEGTDWEGMKASGYMAEAYVIKLAEKAGFQLEGRSEVNANTADTKNHPHGVWSLPPTLRGGEQGRERFLAIGESDRMTLRFRKPGS